MDHSGLFLLTLLVPDQLLRCSVSLSGKYAYVSSAQNTFSSYKKARLVSAQLTGESKCISFAYLMNGKNMGSLDVYVRFSSGSYANLWSKKGHQGKDWHTARVNLPSGSYKIYIEAKVGVSPYSDIAIDDIYIDEGKCLSGKCEDKDTRCDGWVKSGECQKNPSWMEENCCQSCKNPPSISRVTSCKDKTVYATKCGGWANNGECAGKNKEWMLENCCESCKKGTLSSCSDNATYTSKCNGWVNDGHCAGSNQTWMWKNCCYSCKTGCMDKNTRCKEWAGKGECKTNNWMLKNCCKSCSTAATG